MAITLVKIRDNKNRKYEKGRQEKESIGLS